MFTILPNILETTNGLDLQANNMLSYCVMAKNFICLIFNNIYKLMVGSIFHDFSLSVSILAISLVTASSFAPHHRLEPLFIYLWHERHLGLQLCLFLHNAVVVLHHLRG